MRSLMVGMMSSSGGINVNDVIEERRVWVGNLDARITETNCNNFIVSLPIYGYQLLKIVQKCGPIEKFDMLFHKGGPMVGQSRGYAFVTFSTISGALTALDKLDGQMIMNRPVAIRLAKNVNYDELERPKPKIEIPALSVGKREGKISKEDAIKVIEQQLKILENNSDDIDVNQLGDSGGPQIPLIQKYQFNKHRDGNQSSASSLGLGLQRRTHHQHKSNSRPYNKNQRSKRR